MTRENIRSYSLNINFKYIIMAIFVGVFNSMLCHSEKGSLVMVAIEILCLIYFLIRRDMFKYACYYVIFMSLSLEYGAYYGTESIYGFRETRIAGIGVATIAIIPMVLIGMIKFDSSIIHFYIGDKKIKKFIRYIYWIYIIGVIIGLLNILVNDNDVTKMGNVWEVFLGEVYSYTILILFPIVAFTFVINKYPERFEELKSVVFAVLIGLVVSQVFSFVGPFKGTTWDSTTLLVSFVAFYVPTLVCFSFYFIDYRKKMILLIIGLTGTILSTVFTVTSGGLLVVFLIPFLVLLILIERKETASLACWITLLCIAVILGLALLNTILSNASILLEYKLSQALSLLKFWDADWYTNLPPSAKFRFQELGNIIQEFLRKPYTIFVGKGIMGTCLDYNNTFFSTNYVGEGGFLEIEWQAGVFFSMHESINVLFLSSGLFGISFLFFTVKTCLKNLSKSPFLAIGLIYVLFHYNYSFTASNFGIVCLLIGLYEIDNQRIGIICR